jgi:hypothetical protein
MLYIVSIIYIIISSRNVLDSDLLGTPSISCHKFALLIASYPKILLIFFLTKMDNISKTLICTSPDCGSPGTEQEDHPI